MLATCPKCGGQVPSSCVSCIHCGRLAEKCPECKGSGKCSHCGGGPAISSLPCPECRNSGQCQACHGNRVTWPAATS